MQCLFRVFPLSVRSSRCTKIHRNFQYHHIWWSVLDASADVETNDTASRAEKAAVLYALIVSVFMVTAITYRLNPDFSGTRQRAFVREHVRSA
jgi:hypothetical protein